MARWLAIDYGRARIGIALSDPGGRLATPKGVISCKKSSPATAARLVWAEIQKLMKGETLAGIVVGLPLLLSGAEGEMSQEVRKFTHELELLSQQKVLLLDERLSSAQVEKMLTSIDYSRKERATRSDSAAAALLLQTFLDSRSST